MTSLNEDGCVEREVRQFFDLHSLQVYGHLLRMGTDQWLAEEIVVDAFNAAAMTWTTLHDPRAYVYRVARNQRVRRQRQDTNRRAHIQVGLPDDEQQSGRAPTTLDHADAVIDRRDLACALEALPQRQREVIDLRYIRDLSVAETAKVLSLPEGTVKSDTSRGLAALKKLTTVKEVDEA